MVEVKKTTKNLFRSIGKQLMKPVGVTAVGFKGLGNAIGNIIAIASPKIDADEGLKNAAKSIIEANKSAYNILAGKEETSFSKEFAKIREEKKAAGKPVSKFEERLDKAFGIGSDIVLDPLNFLEPAKLVKEVGKLAKVEKIAQTPVAKSIKSLFSTTTGNKEFDTIVKKFRNLRSAREGALLDDAVALQKDIKKMGAGAEQAIVEGLENPKSLTGITDEKILNTVDTLKNVYKGMLEESRKVGLKVGEIMDYAPRIRTKESFLDSIKGAFGTGTKEFSKGSIEKGRTAFLGMTQKEIQELGGKYATFFEKNPAIQLVKKGQAFAKAITAKEFADSIGKFAIDDGVEVANSLLKGKKFSPEMAKVIDNFYQGIKPEELKVVIRGFDKIQNIWKAQALISPSYHIRNIAGNVWNNFLAGVNPWAYSKAGLIQKGTLKDEQLLKEMKELGVIDQGWYAKDIGEEMLNRVDGIRNWKKTVNPLSQENALFRMNRAFGSVIENNARIAHYISKKAEGLSPEAAAESVKKYLFDYDNLTSFEKNVMKRIVPFYTWTRKNIPLQLSELVSQPAKFTLPHKIIENLEAGVDAPNEKYMNPYITENVPVRVRTNEEGNTEYFLLGTWLPYASALDVLSTPLDTMVQMVSPLIKAPIEQWANKSTFFKNTLGEPAEIEDKFKKQGEFLGRSMRKRNISLLRNIRILSDMDKWYDKQDPKATKDSWQAKLLNTLFGKTTTYDVGKSKYFYDMDTDDRISDLKKAIKDSTKRGYKEKANQLKQELRDFIKMRKNGE